MKKQFRLKDKLKLEAVWALTSMNEVDYSKLEEGSTAHRRLKDAGVMHWFEEVNKRNLIGYKLIKPEYEQAALNLGRLTDCGWYHKGSGIDLTAFCKGAEALEKAGVLDLWFEKVYEQPKTINVLSIDGEIVSLTHDQIKDLWKQITD